jgi:DNA-binding LacI/PurR family transcriptional regulator
MSTVIKDISAALMYAVATPHSKVGKRLRSEPDLAEVFAVRRHTIRQSIDVLVEKGVLIRRKGSGTFVNRIPSREELPKVCTLIDEGQILPRELFAECTNAAADAVRLSPASDKNISVGYWSDLQVSPKTGQIFLPYLVKHIAETGNCLHMHSVVKEPDQPHAIDKLVELLRKNPSDAYLLESRWANLLIQALGKTESPVLINGSSTLEIEGMAVVMLDTNSAITRAIKIFKEQGYTRIGLLGFGDMKGHSWQAEVKAYRGAMLSEDLSYSAFQCSDATMSSSIAAARELLSRTDPPEAIYVADDYVMIGVADYFKGQGIIPGKDLGVITFENKGVDLLMDYKHEWSRMQADPDQRASLVVNLLIDAVQNQRKVSGRYSIHPTWVAGTTHLKP